MDVFEAVQAAREQYGVPGVAVGVLEEGVERHEGYGVTSVANPLEVTPETRFQVGSIGKTFTGTAICELVARGELDLDRPVREYIPALSLADADATERVTLRHVLAHTGGWFGDYFDETGWGDDAVAIYVERMRDLPQQTPVGELWAYNNAGFAIAGRVLEIVTGKRFEDVVQELVLDPLDLTATTYWPWEVMTERFAVGHVGFGDELGVARPWPVGRSAAPGRRHHVDHPGPAALRASPSRAATGARADAGAAGGGRGGWRVGRPDLVRRGSVRHDPPRRWHERPDRVAPPRARAVVRDRPAHEPFAGWHPSDGRDASSRWTGGGGAATHRRGGGCRVRRCLRDCCRSRDADTPGRLPDARRE
ncbi:MAG TPA: serine hydrolase domain-containing protein [Gaiellaceae bacterium]|nr:serine hydrolase domain-containing protein [Gaiellaceae bacterium]